MSQIGFLGIHPKLEVFKASRSWLSIPSTALANADIHRENLTPSFFLLIVDTLIKAAAFDRNSGLSPNPFIPI